MSYPDIIPVENFGKDHWSTFAYIETRIVDHGGWIDERHMRGHLAGWEQYPTYAKRDGERWEIEGHSDYDCAKDLVSAGLLEGGRATKRATRRIVIRDEWQTPADVIEPGEIEGLGHHYTLTPKGRVVAAKLRAHKGEGGQFAAFEPGAVLGWMAAGRA